MKKHLFFTGSRGVGKSTLLQKHLVKYSNIAGFATVKVPCGDTFAVHMLPVNGGAPTERNLLFYCDNKRAHDEIGKRFDLLGCEILGNLGEAAVIVMDELGPAESCAKAFQQRVLDLLDGDIPILGVLQEGESRFLQKIISHPAVELVYVTEENRDSL